MRDILVVGGLMFFEEFFFFGCILGVFWVVLGSMVLFLVIGVVMVYLVSVELVIDYLLC